MNRNLMKHYCILFHNPRGYYASWSNIIFMKRRVFLLRGLGISTALIIGSWTVGELLPDKLQTSPTSVYDWTLWPLLRVVWEPFSKKRSHWWHWRTYTSQIHDPVVAKGHPKRVDRSSFWENFYQTNLGWSDAVVLRPANYNGFWHLGFSAMQNNGTVTKLCTIFFKGQKKIAALVGPYDTTFFALSLEGTPITLEIIQLTTKSELPEAIPLI